MNLFLFMFEPQQLVPIDAALRRGPSSNFCYKQ